MRTQHMIVSVTLANEIKCRPFEIVYARAGWGVYHDPDAQWCVGELRSGIAAKVRIEDRGAAVMLCNVLAERAPANNERRPFGTLPSKGSAFLGRARVAVEGWETARTVDNEPRAT